MVKNDSYTEIDGVEPKIIVKLAQRVVLKKRKLLKLKGVIL
jgi:hypothetical protein